MENLYNNYPYLPLNSAQDEIRFLELLPRGLDSSKPIQARLIHGSLKDFPKYDALSYVWGSTHEQTTIQLDDTRDYLVTKNLERALRHISHFETRKNEVVRIWVDAICINQCNVEERNAQVKIMWRIYAAAESVRTWLDVEIPGAVLGRLGHLCTDIQSIDDLGDNPEFWQPITSIVEDPYWSRVWVQQEIAYAKKLLIYCHEVPISHAILSWFFVVLEKYIKEYGPILEHSEHVRWRGLAVGSGPFNTAKSVSAANPRCYKNIYDMLYWTSHLKATDIRDKIYGLLALLEDDVEDIEVNYDLPPLEVYCQVVQVLIQKHHSLAFLDFAGLNVTQNHSDLPTWLPHPRGHLTGTLGPIANEGSSYFSWLQSLLAGISYSTAILPSLSTDHKSLHVHGMYISKIEDVCRAMSWQGDPSFGNFLKSWDDYFNKWTIINNQRDGSLTKLDAMRSFVSIMHICRTSEAVARFVDADTLAQFEQLFPVALAEQLKENPNLKGAMRQFDYAMWGLRNRTMAIASLNRYLVLTQNGIMGLAPMATIPGDEIWMLFRHPIPIILRREGEHFLVVGSAFIDFVTQEKWDDAMVTYEEGDQECNGCEIQCIELK
ncbi:heterokaryon incompatibility protein-domain-containing protein [Cadophora sp. MPI-SDFR-AT-0126]|nr:heterokaryon incompatibility protein-domain-containing protein [Leotiomycetes sp. MPI-SDFR-AT-0126]